MYVHTYLPFPLSSFGAVHALGAVTPSGAIVILSVNAAETGETVPADLWIPHADAITNALHSEHMAEVCDELPLEFHIHARLDALFNYAAQ